MHRPSLILASGSPRRQELLRGLGLVFEVQPSDVDEHVSESLEPGQLVELLAERKASAVADRVLSDNANGARQDASGPIVIGSDTVVVLNGEVLGKPSDTTEAEHMLSRLQGNTHTVYTGLCLIDCKSGKRRIAHSRTEVTMRPMNRDKIRRYVQTGEPLDKAGAYAIQGYGAALVTAIRGDYFTVVGLPLYLLHDLLEEFGVFL